MRNRDWITRRLENWGWHWSAAIQRGKELPHSLVIGTLGNDGVGGGTPGPSVPYPPEDWMRADVLETHRCVLTLTDIFRVVIAAQFIYPEREVKVHCGLLKISQSAYYWRLAKAKRLVKDGFVDGIDLDNVQLESQTLRV